MIRSILIISALFMTIAARLALASTKSTSSPVLGAQHLHTYGGCSQLPGPSGCGSGMANCNSSVTVDCGNLTCTVTETVVCNILPDPPGGTWECDKQKVVLKTYTDPVGGCCGCMVAPKTSAGKDWGTVTDSCDDFVQTGC